MKLLLISASFPPASGGVATHVANLAHSFISKDKNNKAFVLTSSEKKPSKYSIEDKSGKGNESRLNVWKVKKDAIDNFSGRRTPFDEILKEIMTRWHYISPDIIHVHDFDSAYIGLMLKTAFKIPLIFTYHRAPNPWKDFKFQEDTKDCFLEAARIYDFFDFIVVPSKINQKILIDQKFNPQSIKIIKHGVKIKFLSSFSEKKSILAKFRLDSSKTMILCPARFDSHKNAEVFLKAASVLKKDAPSKNFIFVLTDKPEGFYEHIPELALKLGLELGSDLFLEQFKFDEMKTLYKNSAVCIVPSLHESFGQTVIESFVYRTPVIASNSGALPEIIKHKKNGLLFTPNSHEDLVSQIQTLLSNPGLSKSLVDSALEDAEMNYTSELMIKEYVELYKEVIEKGRLPRPPLQNSLSSKTLSDNIIFKNT